MHESIRLREEQFHVLLKWMWFFAQKSETRSQKSRLGEMTSIYLQRCMTWYTVACILCVSWIKLKTRKNSCLRPWVQEVSQGRFNQGRLAWTFAKLMVVIFYTACFHVIWVCRTYLVYMCYTHDPLRLLWRPQSFISSFWSQEYKVIMRIAKPWSNTLQRLKCSAVLHILYNFHVVLKHNLYC